MRILKILFTIIIVFLIAVAALLFFLPGEQIARMASEQVKEQFGRDLQIEGDVELSFFPSIGVTTGPITLSNADWSGNGPMFQAKRAKIGVRTMSLLSGDIHIQTIALTAPDILIERNAQGQANWDDFVAAPSDAATEEASGSAFTLDHFVVSNARIRYLDAEGASVEVPDLTADLTWGEGAATIETMAVFNGAPVAALVELSDLNGMIAGDVVEVGLAATAGKNKLVFKGLASVYPEVAGNVTLEMPEPEVVMAALGQAGARVPTTTFAGDVTFTKEQIASLREGRVSVDGNDLSVEADVNLAGKPNVVASVSAGALDLGPYLAGGSETGESAEGWSVAPIDASALGLFDGSITLSAASIDLGSLNFGSSRVAIDVDNSRAVATLHQLTGYEGTVTGQFVANNRSGFSVGGNLEASNVELQGMLKDLLETDRFTGQANAKLAFLGSGSSVDAIMKSLRGDGSMAVGSGTISGVDLDQLFRGTPNGGTTIFDSMSATWTIEGGVLRNQDLLMELPRLRASGAGTVGLGLQDLDYTFTPALQTQADSAIAVPVRIKGPWSGPRIWPDLEAIAKQQLGDEIEAVEQQVNEEIDKLENQVNDAVDDAKQDLEQQLQQRLQDEIGGALGGLLGGN